MKNTIFFSLMLVLFLLVSTGETLACSCAANLKSLKTQVKESFNNSTAIFSGEVLEISPKSEYELTVKIKIQKSWKGNFSKEITLTTAKDSAMCGYGFETGQKYLIYAEGPKGVLSVSNCSRTTSLDNKADLKFLDRLKRTRGKSTRLNIR